MRLRPLSKGWAISVIVVLLLVAGGSIISGWRYFHRPLFYHTFSRHPDRGILPEWWPFPMPVLDRIGTLTIHDRPTRFIICIPTGDPRYSGGRTPSVERGRLVLHLFAKPEVDIAIPVKHDCAVILDRSGRLVSELTLLPSQFDAIVSSISDETPDAVEVVTRFASPPK